MMMVMMRMVMVMMRMVEIIYEHHDMDDLAINFFYPRFSFTGKLQPWIINFNEHHLERNNLKKHKALISNS